MQQHLFYKSSPKERSTLLARVGSWGFTELPSVTYSSDKEHILGVPCPEVVKKIEEGFAVCHDEDAGRYCYKVISASKDNKLIERVNEGPGCHGALASPGSYIPNKSRVLAICTRSVSRDLSVAEYEFWIDYLINRSILRDVFLNPNVEHVKEYGFIKRTDVDYRLLMTSCNASRFVHEKTGVAQDFFKFVHNHSMPEDLAFIMANCYSQSGTRHLERKYVTCHSFLSSTDATWKKVMLAAMQEPIYIQEPMLYCDYLTYKSGYDKSILNQKLIGFRRGAKLDIPRDSSLGKFAVQEKTKYDCPFDGEMVKTVPLLKETFQKWVDLYKYCKGNYNA